MGSVLSIGGSTWTKDGAIGPADFQAEWMIPHILGIINEYAFSWRNNITKSHDPLEAR